MLIAVAIPADLANKYQATATCSATKQNTKHAKAKSACRIPKEAGAGMPWVSKTQEGKLVKHL
jgi:hypothetical protein